MEKELKEPIECIHEWMIESPNGPTSKGKCLNCEKISEFKNSMPVSGWDRTDNSKAKTNNAKKKAKDNKSEKS